VYNLDYHSHNFFALKVNLKCNTIFNINIVKFLMIHVAIDFSGNHI